MYNYACMCVGNIYSYASWVCGRCVTPEGHLALSLMTSSHMNNHTIVFLFNINHSQKHPLQKKKKNYSNEKVNWQIPRPSSPSWVVPLLSFPVYVFGEIQGTQRLFVIQENNIQLCVTKNPEDFQSLLSHVSLKCQMLAIQATIEEKGPGSPATNKTKAVTVSWWGKMTHTCHCPS